MSQPVRIGQRWKSKSGGYVVTVTARATGNKHWHTRKNGARTSHTTHEGTLRRFYELLPGAPPAGERRVITRYATVTGVRSWPSGRPPRSSAGCPDER